MQDSMTFHLTEADIEDAERYGINNVLLYLTSNRTGTLWRMGHDGVAVEIMPPFRSLRFYHEEQGEWCPYPLNTNVAPCVLKAEICQFNPCDTSPQIEVFSQSLSPLEAPQEGLIKMAYRFFEERAKESAKTSSSGSMPC